LSIGGTTLTPGPRLLFIRVRWFVWSQSLSLAKLTLL